MLFYKNIVLTCTQYATAVSLLLLLGCDNVDESKSTKTVKLTTGLQVCESLNFESDTFQLSDSNDSQLDVFESLFLNNNAYQLPGNPTRESLYAFFKDLRKVI